MSSEERSACHEKREPIPDEFASCEEAAEFWDTHDTTDYPEAFSDAEIGVDLNGRTLTR